MFGKKPDNRTHLPQPSEASNCAVGDLSLAMEPGSNAFSFIGHDLIVTGNVISKGQLQVDGEIQGDTHCTSISVGEQAQIAGGIVAEDVIVCGKAVGSIRGTRVTLQSQSHVEGEINYRSLAIQEGAFFEGKCRWAEAPLVGAQQAKVQNETSVNSNFIDNGTTAQNIPGMP